MNKIILIGNLTHDPEMRATSAGTQVCTFSIAVTRRFSQKGGERKSDFFRVNAWGALAEACSRYLTKGKKVAVIGELQARMYEAKDGTSRLSLDVQADEVEFLSPRDSGEGLTLPNNLPEPDMSGFTDIDESELPF